jgi:hypothetical protein
LKVAGGPSNDCAVVAWSSNWDDQCRVTAKGATWGVDNSAGMKLDYAAARYS